MNFILEYEDLSNYLLADKYVDFDKKLYKIELKNCLVIIWMKFQK